MRLNRTFLEGNLAADPVLEYTPSGKEKTSFRIAHNRNYKVNDEWKSATSWVNVVCFGNVAKEVTDKVHKGGSVLVEGRLEVRDYTDKNGNNRTWVEITADNVVLTKREKNVNELNDDVTVEPGYPSDDEVPF